MATNYRYTYILESSMTVREEQTESKQPTLHQIRTWRKVYERQASRNGGSKLAICHECVQTPGSFVSS
jgi:hypothetical protein